jgi:hypothetical protein
MDWSTEAMEVDWLEEETQEHAFLTVLIEQLELDFEMETCTDDTLEEDFSFNDRLEHTILDKILQDWDEDMQMQEGVLENEAKRPERRQMDDLDECLETIFCERDCQNTISEADIIPTEEWSRGENEISRDRNITTSSVEKISVKLTNYTLCR